MCLSEDQDIEFIEKIYEGLKKNPDNVELLIARGFICLEPGGPPTGSVEALERALKLEPENVDALFWLAKVMYHEFCDDMKAKKLLRKALKINPNRGDCNFFLGGLCDNDTTAIRLVRKSIEVEPTWIYPRMRLAYLLQKQKKLDEAQEEAEKALRIFDTIKFCVYTTPIEEYVEECITGRNSTGKKRAKNLLERIKKLKLELEESKKIEVKINKIDKVLKNNPTSHEKVIQKAFWCIHKLGQIERAVATLKRALRYDKKNVDFMYWLAKAYYEQVEKNKSRKILEKALKIDKNRADCHFLLALTSISFYNKFSSLLHASFKSHCPEISIPHLIETIKLEPTWFFPRLLLIQGYLDESDFKSVLYEIYRAKNLVESIVSKLKDTKFKNEIEESLMAFVTLKFREKKSTLLQLDYAMESITSSRSRIIKSLDLLGIIKNPYKLTAKMKKYRDRGNFLVKELRKKINPMLAKEFICLSFLVPIYFMSDSKVFANKLLERDKNDVDSMFLLANTMYVTSLEQSNTIYDKTANKIMELLNKAIALDTKKAECYSLLADMERFSGNSLDVSIKHLEKAVEIEPSWIIPRIKLAYYHTENNDFKAAEKTAKEARKLFKKMEFPKPKNNTEQYYEEAVTGRTPCRKRSFKSLFALIEKRRKS
ncbi:tetratricopeptide repeat protein, partial [Candidatus Dependentiae bacterium]